MLILLERCQQLLGSLSILRVGWLNLDFQHQTERIHEYMSLPTLYFLTRIVAARPPFSVVLALWLSRIAALASA